MNEIFLHSSTIGTVLTLVYFFLAQMIKEKYHLSWVNPLLFGIVLTIPTLLLLKVDYDSYQASAQYISWFLTPTTVSLAIPLYIELDRLKNNLKAILISITLGSLSSFVSVYLMATLFKLNHSQYVTFLPKSITTAIGMGISEELGGIVSITIAVIIVTGIFGSLVYPIIFKIFKIQHPVAQGLALGTSSHAMGTSTAMEIGETQGAMASLSIVTAGMITLILAQIFANFI